MSGAALGSHTRGARPRDGIPVSVALAAWSACAALVSSLVLLGDDSHADATPAVGVARTATAGRLPDGRDEAGSLAVTAERVRASLPIRHAASLYGWGTLRLDAEPLEDEIRVRAIVDVPTRARRWSAPCDLALRVDGVEVRARAQPVGSRLKSGAYFDAVRFELGIDAVRRLARAGEIEGTLCDDPLLLGPAHRPTLSGFVESFDGIALPAVPSVETARERMPTDPDELPDDPDAHLEPA